MTAFALGTPSNHLASFWPRMMAERQALLVNCERMRCPRCKETCFAEPIKRGAVRLANPDGSLHRWTCTGGAA